MWLSELSAEIVFIINIWLKLNTRASGYCVLYILIFMQLLTCKCHLVVVSRGYIQQRTVVKVYCSFNTMVVTLFLALGGDRYYNGACNNILWLYSIYCVNYVLKFIIENKLFPCYINSKVKSDFKVYSPAEAWQR